MRRLANIRRFSFAILALFLTANLWGQTTLSGGGTEESPYLIKNATDWGTFAGWINTGTNVNSYYKLDANDIVVSTIVGTSANKFAGTFDGNWNTLIFNNGSMDNPCTVEKCAPFGFVGPGTTIKNLTVEGTIISQKKYAAGLIGWVEGSGSYYITNCTSNITINCSKIEEGASNKKYDCSTGGFIGQIQSGNVYFTNCVFRGSILKDKQTSANRCAGFVSYVEGNSVTYTNCTMAGTIDMAQSNNYSTFNRHGNNSFSGTYYINNYGDVPQTGCEQAKTTAPTDDIAKIYTVSTTDYYVPGAVITGLETTTYSYIENQTITIDAPTVSYYGITLRRGTDYVIKKKYGEGEYETVAGDITLSAAGNYDIKIEAKEGSAYGGSKTITIQVVAFNSWSIVKTYLADASKGDRNITLSADITPENPSGADVALVVNGNVVLNLNGHTIDRGLYSSTAHSTYAYGSVINGQVLRISAGASLTINGNGGTIQGGNNKWEVGTESYKDGGGIYNMGTLVLNNVNVTHNFCFRETEATTSATARGGGIYTGSGSSFTMTGGSISSNEGKGGGGGIYCANATTFVMNNVTINGNYCESKGAGIRVLTSDSNTADLTDCYIGGNYLTVDTEAKGGGIYMESGNLNMTRCDIVANSSFKQGSGFYSKKGTTIATNCNIYWNGSNHPSDDDLGAGVYLYDKGSDHSIFIMDGGSIYENNSMGNGGGIYVEQGAVFQVKGNVIIKDNYKATVGPGAIDNNAYLAGTAYIEVIEPGLGNEAIINITPHGGGGVAVEFADGASSGSLATDLSHFQLDGSDYNLIINADGTIESYEPYSWNETSTWNGTIAENSSGTGTVPTSGSTIRLHRAVKIPSGVTANVGTIYCDAFCDIVIEDGAQLITNSTGVAVLAKKKIVAADADKNTGWYLISAPVNTPAIAGETPATNLIATVSYRYDLYRYNEAADLQWENYRAHSTGAGADFTTLENGRGYLYRNSKKYTIDIGGTLDVSSSVDYNLSCHATTSPSGNDNILKGFNIIGNPYSHNIAKGTGKAIPNDYLEENYYVLNPSTGNFDLTTDGTIIPPLTGILVQATSASTLTIRKIVASASKDAKSINDDEMWFTINNSEFEDKACVKFKEGHGLNKIEHLNEDAPMLYIHHNGEDFASVDMNPEAKEFNLNLEAKTTGKYTLKVEKTGAYSYLHLIDKLAEKDIDLLEENEYSFVGSPADAADRFIVRLNLSDSAENSVFAYQSGDEIVVSGEGELQVFDVMGRLVAQKHVSGVQTIAKPTATGVYILRLNENTQKIIIK